MRSVALLVVWGALFAPPALVRSAQTIDPRYAKNLTLYHQDRNTASPGIVNKNTGDAAGDTYFSLKDAGLAVECHEDPRSFDCQNPEVNNKDLVVTKLVVEVDARFGPYALCNTDNATGEYFCQCAPPRPHNCASALKDLCGSSQGSTLGCKLCEARYTKYLEYYKCTSDQEKAFCTKAAADDAVAAAASCDATMASLCGKDQSSTSRCEYCLEENKATLSAAGCGQMEEYHFCHNSTNCNASVGLENVVDNGSVQHTPETGRSPNYDFWNYNMAHAVQGKWYSTLDVGHCEPTGPDGPCYWRVVDTVKRVTSDCQQKWIRSSVEKMGNECFSGCPNPTNQSSVCWADCFFTTTLGKGASTSTSPSGGMGPDNLVALWTAAFDSEDPTKGGCPSVPTANYK